MTLNRLLTNLSFKTRYQTTSCIKFETRMHVKSFTVYNSILYLMKVEGTFTIREEASRVIIHEY